MDVKILKVYMKQEISVVIMLSNSRLFCDWNEILSLPGPFAYEHMLMYSATLQGIFLYGMVIQVDFKKNRHGQPPYILIPVRDQIMDSI